MMVMSCCRTKLIYCFISDPIKKENEDSGAYSDKGNDDFMNGQRKIVGEEKESNSDIRKKNRKSWDRAKNGKKEGGIDEQTTLKYSIYRQKNEKMNMEVKKKV